MRGPPSCNPLAAAGLELTLGVLVIDIVAGIVDVVRMGTADQATHRALIRPQGRAVIGIAVNGSADGDVEAARIERIVDFVAVLNPRDRAVVALTSSHV